MKGDASLPFGRKGNTMGFKSMGNGLAAAVLAALSLGCGGALTPTAGETCTTANVGTCEGTVSALFCINGKWTSLPCRGAGGCKEVGGQVTCDQTLGMAGETCHATGTGTGACAVDGQAQLTCQGGTFVKGSDCVTCNITSTNQVVCQQPCSAATCTGCCFNGQCQTGNTASACGKAGSACTACGNNQVCKVNQTCGVDPESRWRVQPLSAVITPTNNGAQWDTGGSPPDPFIVMGCPPLSAPIQTSTPAVADTLNPTWTSGGCVTTAAALLSEPWQFQPYDEDISSHDPISQAWAYQFEEGDFQKGTITLNAGGGLTSITVQLQKQ